MKYEIRQINPINGSEAAVQRDSINGDNLVIAQGDKAAVISIKEITLYITTQEAKKQQQATATEVEPVEV